MTSPIQYQRKGNQLTLAANATKWDAVFGEFVIMC